MSSILSVALRMDSTTGSPSVRFGTKWLSITSTCMASELGTDSIAVCRFAKSADKMLGMILRATVSTLVSADLAQIGRKHGISAVPVRPELQVRTESGVRNLGQQFRRRDHLDVSANPDGFTQHIARLPAVR